MSTVEALPRLRPVPGRAQVGLLAALLGLALVAWLVTDNRMTNMDAGPGTDLGGLGFYVTSWVVMMAAMMFPSITPMVAAHAWVQRGRREAGMTAPAGATAVFVAGYLVAWTAAGLLAYGVFSAFDAAEIGVFAWERAGRWIAAGVLVGAAAYQLTPLKQTCLRHCRGPLAFVLEHWHEGRLGALRMGVAHGAWCVGCCWALMAALFALGVMSIGWMLVVAALIAVEKLAPWRIVATYGVATLLLALGIWVASAPSDLPGLTIPGSPDAAMSMSPGEQMAPSPGADQGMSEEGMSSGAMGADDGMSAGGIGAGGN